MSGKNNLHYRYQLWEPIYYSENVQKQQNSNPMKPFSWLSDTGYMSLNKQSKHGEPPVNAKCLKEKEILPEWVQGETHNRANIALGTRHIPAQGRATISSYLV